jgi:tetratricopeptide (TPR) repeat protein
MNVQGRKDAQATLLSSLKKQQEDHPSWNWTEENKVNLLLAQNYASSGNYEQALALFDRIVANNPTLRTFTSACACLEGARLRIANWIKNHALATNPECTKTLSQLKNLMLQRSLANEPIHLEAAIEYIDLQTALVDSETRIQKRLYLLSKTKDEFEATDDLLSQDYQKSRAILIDKDRLYRSYLHYFEGEILLCKSLLSPEESEKNLLQKRAKEFYQELTASCTTMFLINRAQKQLETLSP